MGHLPLLLVILFIAYLILGPERFKEEMRQIFSFCRKVALLIILLIYGPKRPQR
jgi:Sec-independent protein translocase protein TatA